METWKQKHKSEHGTCDKKILIPVSIQIYPLFDELKKEIFLSPSPLYGPMSHSQPIFFEGISASLMEKMGVESYFLSNIFFGNLQLEMSFQFIYQSILVGLDFDPIRSQ